jgi:hypothetical protein
MKIKILTSLILTLASAFVVGINTSRGSQEPKPIATASASPTPKPIKKPGFAAFEYTQTKVCTLNCLTHLSKVSVSCLIYC